MIDLLERERSKYNAAWDLPEYSEYSPGAHFAPVFAELVPAPACVIDLGCGKGDGGVALAALGYDVTYLDLVRVPGHPEPFIEQPLWDHIPWLITNGYDAGYCCDVLEHIPTEMVGLVLHRIADATEQTFFSIGLTADVFGQRIGEPLHLTVRPFTWWRDLLKMFGTVLDARDLGNTGLYFVKWHGA